MPINVVGPGGQTTPLDYMMAIINNSDEDPVRRDKMAIAAAPYYHPRQKPRDSLSEAAALLVHLLRRGYLDHSFSFR
jgi:hypothetical protein